MLKGEYNLPYSLFKIAHNLMDAIATKLSIEYIAIIMSLKLVSITAFWVQSCATEMDKSSIVEQDRISCHGVDGCCPSALLTSQSACD